MPRRRNTGPEDQNVVCWRWAVVAGAFWLNLCLLGVQRSQGVIFVALVDAFGVSREDAAWPSGIFGFCMCITAVLSGFLNQYFSHRCLMMVGGAMASLAVSLCCYAQSIQHIVLLYGAFQGAGIGMVVPLTHVIINQYFATHRALAMGIAYAGSSLGTFAFPPLAHWMLEEFGLPGTFLLLGGIMLNSLLGVALFRRPPKLQTSPKESPSTNHRSNREEDIQSSESKVSCRRNVSLNISGTPKEESTEELFKSVKPEQDKTICPMKAVKTSNPRQSLFPNWHALQNKLPPSIQQSLEILTNSTFLAISAAFAVYNSSSTIFLMVILDFAQDRHMPRGHGVFLVSAYSIGDLAGRLSFGWIADLQCIQRRTLVWWYLVVMGCLLMVIPCCFTFETLAATSIVLGVLSGSIIVNFSVLLIEHLGPEKLALSVGFSTCIIGLTAFLRPVVIGYFRDVTLSYDLLFVSLGAVQVLVTSVWFLENIIQKRKYSVPLPQT